MYGLKLIDKERGLNPVKSAEVVSIGNFLRVFQYDFLESSLYIGILERRKGRL